MVAILSMASQPALMLCASSVAAANAVDRNTLSHESFACVDEVMQEIEQRLACDANWFYARHADAMWKEASSVSSPLNTSSAGSSTTSPRSASQGAMSASVTSPSSMVSGTPSSSLLQSSFSALPTLSPPASVSADSDLGGSGGLGTTLGHPAPIESSVENEQQVFSTFCVEVVGIIRTALQETYAAFFGSDALDWLKQRTRGCVPENVAAEWLKKGWVVTAEGSVADEVMKNDFTLYHLTDAGLKVWDCGYPCYEKNRGSLTLQTYEQFSRSENSSQELDQLDELHRGILLEAGVDALKRISGDQLCRMVSKHEETPFVQAMTLCLRLGVFGFLSPFSEELSGVTPLEKPVAFSSQVYYSFTGCINLSALNVRRCFVGNDGRNPPDLAAACHTQIRDSWNLLHMTVVQKISLNALPMWRRFSDMVLELQKVNIDSLTGDAAVAFWINVYNTLFLHVWVVHKEIGISKEDARYNIGGVFFTLRDVRESVLAGETSSDAMAKYRIGLTGDNIFKMLLLSNDTRIAFTTVSAASLSEDWKKQLAEDLSSVEIDAGHLKLAKHMEFLVKVFPTPLQLLKVLVPHLSSSWQTVAKRILERDENLVVEFVNVPDAIRWNNADDDTDAVVGGGMSKELWANGVFKRLNEAKASVVALREDSLALSKELERAQEEQRLLKHVLETQEDHIRVYEQDVKRLKEEHDVVSRENATRRAELADASARTRNLVDVVREMHETMKKFLHNECGGAQHATLEALYERITKAPVLQEAADSQSNKNQKSGLRHPWIINTFEDAPFKWVEQTHTRWIKEKCKQIGPSLEGDNAFLVSVARVHSEMSDDPNNLNHFFEKGMIECYARFLSTWKERVSLLLTQAIPSETDLATIVAGWSCVDGLCVGLMQYRRAKHPQARDNVDRLIEYVGLDQKLVDVATSLPQLIGLSRPGRFVLLHATIPCRVGDTPERPLEVVLCSDLLLVVKEGGDVKVHKLEQCAVQDPSELQVEVFDSGYGTRLCFVLDSPEKQRLWSRMFRFACAATKAKHRLGQDPSKRANAGVRSSTSFDAEIIRRELEREREKKG